MMAGLGKRYSSAGKRKYLALLVVALVAVGLGAAVSYLLNGLGF